MDDAEAALAEFAATLVWVPNWLINLTLFTIAIGLAVLLHRVVFRIVTNIAASMDLFWRALVARTKGPTRLAFMVAALAATASVAPLTSNGAVVIRHVLQVGFIVLLGWVAKTAVHIWTTVYLRRFKLDAEDNLLARKHVTQSRILRRVADLTIAVITAGAVLMTFESVQQYGVSLLASAGAAGLVAGLALQPVLKNLFAGIQLAVTQPIRIDDALLVEGEWGNVEEITSTYVVVRIWDWRRLILPLSYFIEQPFQNWTREGAKLIGSVMLYVDYSVPVDVLRAKAQEFAKSSMLWDGEVFALQVTDFRETTMEIRVLVSARTSSRAFDLRCDMREKLIGFLLERYPNALPRTRADVGVIPEPVMAHAMGAGRGNGRGRREAASAS